MLDVAMKINVKKYDLVSSDYLGYLGYNIA